MKSPAHRSLTVLGGAALIAAVAPLSHAVQVSLPGVWPAMPAIEAANPDNDNGERDVRADRDLAQTFQVLAPLTIDKITILVGQSEDNTQNFDLVIFPVADVQAASLVSSGADLLRVTVNAAGLPIPTGTSTDWVPLEFDLEGAEEITLPASAGTAGYAFRLDDPNIVTGSRPFKWRRGPNVYPNGAYYQDGGAVNLTLDFTLAIDAVVVDTDGDGLPKDWEDANGLDDNDATGDNGADGDPDGDGLSNLEEFNRGTDPQNPDSDGDGINDGDEVSGAQNPFGNAPTDPLNPDSDGDGVDDGAELDPGNGSVTNPADSDTDGEGASDGAEIAAGTDPLDPNDFPSGLGNFIALVAEENGEAAGVSGTHQTGIFFDEEVDCFTDRTHEYNGVTAAGLPANLVGGDYVMTANDARDNANYVLRVTTDAPCSFFVLLDNRNTPPAWMADGVDLDFIDTGADVGIDESGDGVGPGNSIENASSVYIAIDRNNGDAVEFSPGVYEFYERGGSGNNMYGVVATAPAEDVDGDGLPKDWEEANGLDDNDATGDNGADGDPDGDGLSNLEEFNRGTDPQNPDSDGDGLSDGDEVSGAQNPFGNAATDPLDPDTDGDGVRDGLEIANGSDPTDAGSLPSSNYIVGAAEQNGQPEGLSGTHETGILFDEDVPSYTDRTHEYNGVTAAGLPAYLVGGDYVMTANDSRSIANYVLTVTTDEESSLYLLLDDRVTPALGGLPAWMTDGVGLDFTDTGDDVGIDEDGNGVGPGASVERVSSVFIALDTSNGNSPVFPAGEYQFFQQNAGNLNMYGVVATAPFLVVDSDGDGMPDEFELAYGLDPNDATGDNGAQGDASGNGLSNILSYLYGLDPSAPGAPPELDLSGGTINQPGTPVTQVQNLPDDVDFCLIYGRIKLYTTPGLTLTVEFSHNLADWVPSADPGVIIADNGTLEAVKVTYPFFLPNGRKARFWRLVVN